MNLDSSGAALHPTTLRCIPPPFVAATALRCSYRSSFKMSRPTSLQLPLSMPNAMTTTWASVPIRTIPSQAGPPYAVPNPENLTERVPMPGSWLYLWEVVHREPRPNYTTYNFLHWSASVTTGQMQWHTWSVSVPVVPGPPSKAPPAGHQEDM